MGHAKRRGHSLFELLGAVAVLSVALNTLLGTMVESMRHQAATRERSAAMDRLESVMEQIGAAPFDEIYRRYNALEDDDVAGGFGSPGAAFDVPGLEPRPGDPDGRVGRVEFPGDGALLLEDVDDPALGMPRDLNMDGDVDGFDHADDYRLLPVRVVVEWQGRAGPGRVAAITTLGG